MHANSLAENKPNKTTETEQDGLIKDTKIMRLEVE